MPQAGLIRRLVRYCSVILVLGSLGFLAHALVSQFQTERELHFGSREMSATALAALAYGIALAMLALAWVSLLTDGLRAPGRRHLFVAYAKSSIFKYLPGNVFHFVGRNVYGKSDERTHWRMAAATATELALSCLAAVGIAAGFVAGGGRVLPGVPWPLALLVPAAGYGGGLVILRLLPPRHGRLAALHALRPGLPLATTLSLVSFLAMGVIAAAFAEVVWPGRFDFAATAAAYLLAWLAGVVVPGAPGGIGIREAVLVLLLSPTDGQAVTLQLALMLRLVTTFGDVVLFGAGRLIEIVSRKSYRG